MHIKDPTAYVAILPSETLMSAKHAINCKLRGSVARSTQPCISPGSLNRVPASAGVRAGMSPLLRGW